MLPHPKQSNSKSFTTIYSVLLGLILGLTQELYMYIVMLLSLENLAIINISKHDKKRENFYRNIRSVSAKYVITRNDGNAVDVSHGETQTVYAKTEIVRNQNFQLSV